MRQARAPAPARMKTTVQETKPKKRGNFKIVILVNKDSEAFLSSTISPGCKNIYVDYT